MGLAGVSFNLARPVRGQSLVFCESVEIWQLNVLRGPLSLPQPTLPASPLLWQKLGLQELKTKNCDPRAQFIHLRRQTKLSA